MRGSRPKGASVGSSAFERMPRSSTLTANWRRLSSAGRSTRAGLSRTLRHVGEGNGHLQRFKPQDDMLRFLDAL